MTSQSAERIGGWLLAPLAWLLVALLSADGVEIVSVATGDEALRMLSARTFDCMVLDLTLPDISGFDLLDIIGKDVTITMAAEAGQLELNVMEPIIAFSLSNGIHRLRQAMRTLQDRCVSGITANKERCRSMVENSIGIITALNPYLGYETSASIAKEALETGGSVIDIVLARNLLSREKLDDILAPEHMINRK